MKYKNFEELPVWKAGIELTRRVFLMTEDESFRFQGDLANQIQRASLSVPNNISEGFERGTTNELIAFLYYAKGSAGEVRSILHVLDRLPRFDHLKSKISELKTQATSISRQLSAWTASLQETDIKGPRHLTEASKKTYHGKKGAEAFTRQIQEQVERAAEKRRMENRGHE